MDTPEMEQQVRVTDDGNVPLAYIGSVHVAGQTPAAAATTIEGALIAKHVMHKPQVTVRMMELATQDVSVTGPGAHAGHLLHHDAADHFEGVVPRGRPERHGRSPRGG